jgi:1-acyl-sn-glycerol-3-phosphate acyltransferase
MIKDNNRTATTIKECNKLFSEVYTRFTCANLLQHISDCYFRVKFIGFDDLPERTAPEKPLIYISNHSGMAFSWDSIMFTSNLLRRTDYDYSRSVRVLADPMLNVKRLMTPYLIKDFWKKLGCIDATHKNFDAMMFSGESNLMIYPEGNDGLCKGFDKKYQLQTFSNTFLLMSLKHRTDIIPFYTINAEYNNPNSYKSERVNRFVNKFGVPFLPVGLSTVLLLFQPWLFYFSFPSNITFVMGDRINPERLYKKDPSLITTRELNELAETIRLLMQNQLTAHVRQYGRSPYNVKLLMSAWKEHFKTSFIHLPVFWPFLFSENDKLANTTGSGQYKGPRSLRFLFKSVFNNFTKVIFFIPILGWIPILISGQQNQK